MFLDFDVDKLRNIKQKLSVKSLKLQLSNTMPKRLRYTQVLGLNKRGLSHQQKRKIVWKKDVRKKVKSKTTLKLTRSYTKRNNSSNEYWDKYHDEEQRFDAFGLKEFLSNPSKILQIPPKDRKLIYEKLRNAQFRIEGLKSKYSVAIPDKESLILLSVIGKGQGIIQMKTSNHDNGYWSYLLKQRQVSCKIFNVFKAEEKKSKKASTQKTKQWTPILNKDCSSKIQHILKDHSNYALLMIYPDFIMDNNTINQTNDKKNDDEDNEKHKYKSFGHMMSVDNVENKENKELPSLQCLKHFKGNWIVHIGELFGYTFDGLNPWGKTTSMQFQIYLQTHFHKVYQHEMRRWPLFRDTITVWRRNKIVNVGQNKILNVQDDEISDNINTNFWKSIFKTRLYGKQEKNIFAAANYGKDRGKYVDIAKKFANTHNPNKAKK